MDHFEYFVLQHFVVLPIYHPAEGSVTRLSICVLAVAIERMRKIRAAAVIGVAFVINNNVMTTPESRSVIWMVESGISIVGVSHLLFQVQ